MKKDKVTGKPVPPMPEQVQEPHGKEHEMTPKPYSENPEYAGSGRLVDKVAVITGGDSGIGRAVAISFAKEGADVVVVYYSEDKDAHETQQLVEKEAQQCLLVKGDIGDEEFCKKIVDQTINTFGQIDILVNNAAVQTPQDSIEKISKEQLERTFRTNIFAMFYLTKAAMPYLQEGASIINTTSVTAYKGSPQLLDYSSTKGAIVAFTYSLSQALAEKKIRVNAVAPGPIWTPLIVSTFGPDKSSNFGSDVPLKRPGQPDEVAPSFVFLASNLDSSYITGQVLHPNGGTVVHG